MYLFFRIWTINEEKIKIKKRLQNYRTVCTANLKYPIYSTINIEKTKYFRLTKFKLSSPTGV